MPRSTPSATPEIPIRKLAAALFAVLAIVAGLWQLGRTTQGLSITQQRVGNAPVTVFMREDLRGKAPVVVIAHGFAGSQQLMLPFATTLARNGYIAVTFDFPGHAHNPEPLTGSLLDQDAFTRPLLATLDDVVIRVRMLPQSDGRMALLGHSMASDIVVRYAQRHPDIVAATIAVSLFFPGPTADSPRNLLIIDGALEATMMHDEALRIVGLVADGKALPDRTYGRFDDGTAHRLALARGAEHIAVLYVQDSLREAVAWLNAAFARRGSGEIDHRGGALGLLYVGLILLAWPLASVLPRVADVPRGAGLRWKRLWPVALAPAVVTPLLLWPLPSDFLPILLGDYLVLHFALYGLLTAVGLRWVRHGDGPNTPDIPVRTGMALLAVIATAAYSVLAIGLPIDRYVTAFLPGAWRVPLIAAMLCGTLPYFLADEWLTRGEGAARGGYALTKLCFLLSLVIAVALNLEKLFFLIIIVPVILIFFVVYGLFSAWTYQRTRHPAVAALANALLFAWFIAVTFPVVNR